jgi:senataxin
LIVYSPPGTGKTSTICGLIDAFLAKRRSPVTSIQAGKSAQPSISRKALVCAPSNAAIDELAKRLRDGSLKNGGANTVPSVVRLGAESAINVSVKDISLDQLVAERLSKSSTGSGQVGTEVTGLRSELARVKEMRETKQAEVQASQGNTQRLLQLEKELRELTSKRIELSARLTAATDKSKDAARAVDSAKRKARLDILNEADIICCTLSGAGHDIIEQFEFDLIVIDEAAQAIELSSLIPLKFSSKQCIMVGGKWMIYI